MTKKVIAVVCNGDKKRTFALGKVADYEKVLSDFNVLGLKDDAGVEIVDFLLLENGQSYNFRRAAAAADSPCCPLPCLPRLIVPSALLKTSLHCRNLLQGTEFQERSSF
jgi:hypothetical protein